MRGVRGCLSLAIVWTQFLSRCIDHRQGVAEGGQAGNKGGGGGWYSGGDGYRGKVTAHCILSLHVDSEQESGWSLESLTERERAGVGGIFAPVVWRSVPSPAHVHDEVMRDPGPLTNSGQMGRGFFPTITLQQRALEPTQLLLYREKIITGSFRRILNQHCFTARCTVQRMSLNISAVSSSSISAYSILTCTYNRAAKLLILEALFNNPLQSLLKDIFNVPPQTILFKTLCAIVKKKKRKRKAAIVAKFVQNWPLIQEWMFTFPQGD